MNNNLEYIGIFDGYIINFIKWWNYITKDLINYHFLFTNLFNKIGVSCINNDLDYKIRFFISLNSLEFYKELEFIIKIIFEYCNKDKQIYLKYCYNTFNKKDNTFEYYINITCHFLNNNYNFNYEKYIYSYNTFIKLNDLLHEQVNDKLINITEIEDNFNKIILNNIDNSLNKNVFNNKLLNS